MIRYVQEWSGIIINKADQRIWIRQKQLENLSTIAFEVAMGWFSAKFEYLMFRYFY